MSKDPRDGTCLIVNENAEARLPPMILRGHWPIQRHVKCVLSESLAMSGESVAVSGEVLAVSGEILVASDESLAVSGQSLAVSDES